jgi:N-acetylneuraminic acid mutarotase
MCNGMWTLKKSAAVVVLLVGFIVIGSIWRPDGVTAATVSGKWRRVASMPKGAVFAATVVGRDGRIYVISGYSTYDGPLTDAVQLYDPVADAWTEGAPIPTPRTSAGVAAGSDGRIYVIGGLDRGRQQNVVEAYDPPRNVWKSVSPLPTRRDALQAVSAWGPEGRALIYVIGGRDRGAPGVHLDTVEAYDPAADTWSSCARMPERRHGCAAATGPDGKIYVCGGTNEKVFATTAVDIYDPVRDIWATGPPMPHGVECAAAASTSGRDGEVIVFGGWAEKKRAVGWVSAFSPRTGKWRQLPPMTARAASGAVVIGGSDGTRRALVLGGTGEGGSGKAKAARPAEALVEALNLVPAP